MTGTFQLKYCDQMLSVSILHEDVSIAGSIEFFKWKTLLINYLQNWVTNNGGSEKLHLLASFKIGFSLKR
jgi:hypothetical protein